MRIENVQATHRTCFKTEHSLFPFLAVSRITFSSDTSILVNLNNGSYERLEGDAMEVFLKYCAYWLEQEG